MGRSILVSVLVLSVLWKRADSECTLGCKGSASAPGFLNGHSYNYGVEGTVSIYLTGAERQETSVKLLGQASVTSLGNCVNELKVQNLVISGPDGKKYSSPPGMDKPIRFTLQDGRVGPEICAEADDNRRSLNIKRAIVTLLQTENKPSTQVDVFGACPTEASSSKEGSALLVHRTRDLSRCAHREQGKNDFLTAIYNPTAEIKDTQVLQSNLNVESKVNNGIPEKVAATEEYLYRPFSVGENGARAKVHTKLTLTGKGAGAASGAQCTESRTIIFEAPHGEANTRSNYDASLAAVKDTARTLGSEASFKSAGEFAQLVRMLRTTSKDDLIKIYRNCKTNKLEKRVFLDGLLRTGTGPSIEASIEILRGKELNQLEEKLVFLSLGNARHVNNDAIKAAATLLDQPNLPKEVYLGVGALAGAFCREHDCHTSQNDGVVALSQKLASKLNCKPKSKVEEDVVVAVMKGIRNIRHLENSLVDKLAHCASDNGAKARVRVAALEAFGADPCAAKLKKTALDIMKNRQLDSEIRIKGYLAVIECPCGGSASEIKTMLDSEPVHQVGRFITSSLRAIRSSANPDKRHARHHYGQISTPNKFNVDERKYSAYEEVSYNIDALGVGGTIEKTMIYSQDSFLPRSLSLNLTAEVFGHSMNVLEVGGRQGNLDRVAEHFFGPKSFLRRDNPSAVYEDILRRFHEAETKVENELSRGRRSIKTDVDNFDKKLKAEAIQYNNELDLDLYMKLFGTDAVFLSLGDDKGIDFNAILDQFIKTINGGINQLKNFKQELRAHLLFMDAQLSYPTSTGLPLKLDLVGAATGRLDVATNVDLRQCYRNPTNAKVDIKLVPSSDIEVAGIFLVDADAVATGLKVTTNLHSSTGGHVIAKILEDGHGFDLQLGLPVDKQEILTAGSDLVYFTAEKGQKEKHTALKIDAERKDYSECFDQLSSMLGVTLCGQISVPFSVSAPDAQASISKFIARYPLTGPAKIKVVLEKNDLRGYHVKGVVRSDRTENPEKRSFELLFEAEGSKNRRTQVTGELINKQTEKSVKLSLQSPLKTLYGEFTLKNSQTEKIILMKAKLDDMEYYAKAGATVSGNNQKSIYRPIIEYQIDASGKQNLKIDGQITRDAVGSGAKYTFEGIHVKIPNTQDVIDINGFYVDQGPQSQELDLKAKKGDHNLLLGASLKGKDLKLEFQNTLNPFVNFKLTGHIDNGNNNYHNDLELCYGQDLNSRENRVIFNQLLKYSGERSSDFSLITKNKFEIVALPIKAQLDLEVDPKKFDVDIEGVYFDKSAKLDLESRTHIKKPGDYSMKLNINVDKDGVEVFSKRDIVTPDKSNFENYIEFKGYSKYELSGVVLHKTKPNDMNVGAIGHLKISGGGMLQDIKFDIGAIENPNLYSSHAKVTGPKGDLLDYLLKVTRGANLSGQLKFILRDTIAANGQFKVTDNDGKGNGLIIIDFKKIQRKIKGDVKFVVKDPVYNAEVDLYLNFEKDNNDKIHLTTNTKRTDKLFDSKNQLTYAGKKSELIVRNEGNPAAPGKSKAFVEVVLPTERCLSFKLDQDLSVKDDVVNGNGYYVLSDSVKRGGASSSISFKTKVVNTNYEKETVDYQSELNIKLKDNKDLHNTFYVKIAPNGEGKVNYDLKGELKGNLIPKSAGLDMTGVSKGYETDYVSEDFKFKAWYGEDVMLDMTEKFEFDMADNAPRRVFDDWKVNIRLPIEKARDIKYVQYAVFVTPLNSDVWNEFTIIESVHVNGEEYRLDAAGKVGEKTGNVKTKMVVPHVEPLVFDVNYQADTKDEQEKQSLQVEVKSQYGKGKTARVKFGVHSEPREAGIVLQAHAPHAEKLKKLELSLAGKNPSPDTYAATVSVDADGRMYTTESLVVYSKSNPVIDIKFKDAETGPGRIYLKGNSISSNQGKLDIKIENVKDISLDASCETNIQRDNINVKLFGNSAKFGWKNYKVEITSKDAGGSKRLELHAVNDNKNVLSGSTSFISKQEGSKTIVEGSGSVKIHDEQKSSSFKYIRTLLTEGNEQGVETFLNIVFGERSYVAESRVTNLEYKNSYVYCEEKKQCAHAELQSKLNVLKPGVFQHVVNAGFDLRKLGFAPEFGLQVLSEVSEKKLPQFTLDLHVNKEDKKYYLHVYSQPEYGKFPAGITVTLPQRVLALEGLVRYPTNKAMPFPMEGEVAIHLDKNKPQNKASARFRVDAQGSEAEHNIVALFGVNHPKLGKEATLKFTGKLARPNENTVKFETSGTFSHPPCGKDREFKFYFEASPVAIKVLADTPLVKVIDLEGSVTLKENLQQSDLRVCLLEGKVVQIVAIAREFQHYEFSTGYLDESERKLSVVANIDPEKGIDASADLVFQNEKKNIIHGALYYEDHQLKTDYGASEENYQYFVKAVEKDLNALQQKVKQLADKGEKDMKATIHKMEPYFKQVQESYMKEMDAIVKEISNDQALKEISNAFYEVVQFLAKMFDDIATAVNPLVDQYIAVVKSTWEQILETYEEQLEPQIKQLFETLTAVANEYLKALLELAAHFSALFQEFYNKHKAELEELTNTVAEIFKDLTKLLVAQMKEFREKSEEFFSGIIEQIQELPIVNILKEKWTELAVPDQALALLQNLHDTIRAILPTDETRNFADAVFNYASKKLRQEKVDDTAELRVVYEKFALALTSFVQFVRTELNELGVPTLLNINAMPMFSGPGQVSSATFGGEASASILNRILRGEEVNPLTLLREYRPRSINPFDEIPSKLRAVIVNGQHIFTFDGRHMTFPGTCRYVLAHDHVDRNFTLLAQLHGGVMKALILEDQSGTTVELKDNGQVALNGAAHGFPVIEKDIFAFREPNGRVGLGSTYGIMVRCLDSKLNVCYVEVNGFYLGKLRGLLGDGNNEPYDDFRLPNGKICTSESEFGNAYRLASSCAPAQAPEHSHHQMHGSLPAACDQVFGSTSPLRPLSLLLDAAPFRQACIHAVAANPEKALQEACDIGRGYTALALTGMLPAALPGACVRCSDAGQPREVGDTYEFKVPAKQADIVVVFDTTKPTEKYYKTLVVPLVGQLVDALKAKHCTDIKVYLAGTTPKMPYPIVYDTDLKLKNAKVKFDDESRYLIQKPTEGPGAYVVQLQNFIEELKIKLAINDIVLAEMATYDFPMRPGAVKHMINVIGETCRNSNPLLEFVFAVTSSVWFEEAGVSHALVAPTPDFTIGGGKNPAQVVGFTEDSVLLLGDKKQNKDTEALRATLEVNEDPCIEFVEWTDGLVLSATNYEGLNPGQQKQYLQTAAAAIINKMYGTQLTQECSCMLVDGLRARSVCMNKERKEMARRRK